MLQTMPAKGAASSVGAAAGTSVPWQLAGGREGP